MVVFIDEGDVFVDGVSVATPSSNRPFFINTDNIVFFQVVDGEDGANSAIIIKMINCGIRVEGYAGEKLSDDDVKKAREDGRGVTFRFEDCISVPYTYGLGNYIEERIEDAMSAPKAVCYKRDGKWAEDDDIVIHATIEGSVDTYES